MENAAIYARVSTDKQEKFGVSLEAQVARCEQYAKNLGLEVICVGVEAQSGKDTDRPELQTILDMVAKKRINHVLTVKLDRLSRDTEDACKMGKSFAKKGVTLHLVSEGGPVNLADPSQEMLFTMRAAMGTFERKRISLNTKFALQRKIELGQKVGSRAPYGYKFDGTNVVVNHDEKAIIIRIQTLHIEGFSIRKIISKLATDGIFNRQGNQFTVPAIHSIIKKAA
jgi:site-specific DNA recombinase